MVSREVLPNGVRVISESVPHVQSVSVGLWVVSGARDEDSSNRGISHFVEHMLFKGTETRTARQIADEFDSIGGQLNAFTDKEYTCFHARVLSEHLPIAVDVVGDMFLNSVFDPREVEVERSVVLEEIKRHEDTPDELIHDVFTRLAWDDHPLGNPVLGSRDSVEGLTPDALREFARAGYTGDGVIISAAGNVSHEEFVDRMGSLFGGLEGERPERAGAAPCFASGSVLTDKHTEQVHFCIGTPGLAQAEPAKYALALMDTTLGGGMSSRLFQEIREKRGLAYAIGSYSAAYGEGGLFAVYGGTSTENVEEVLQLVRAECAAVLRNNITDEELTRAKNQIRGGLVLSQESMASRAVRMAKSEIYFGRVVALEELISCILKVTHDDIAGVAQQIFGEEAFAVAAIGPFGDRKVVD